jgi:hypothetical protein
MNEEQKINRLCLYSVICIFVATYLLTAFALYDMNPGNWEAYNRVGVVFFSVLISVCVVGVIFSEYKK